MSAPRDSVAHAANTINSTGAANSAPPANKAWYWLLLVPYIAILWLPSYNSVEPIAFGVPFFYWYQLLWVVLSTLVIGVVFYFAHIVPGKSQKKSQHNKREH